jgi:nucleoid-associated protein YgaU
VRVIQGPTGVPEAQTELQIDTISYTLEGEVALSGRGPADRQVQILLNNQPIQLGEIGPGGEWSLELPDVDPGTYTLTVAQLSASGEIETSVETPFLREDPARIAASPMRVETGVSVITVQPGFTLWGIAEANFGDGIAYVQIFQENRASIRNPDLIFPGQIFQLPDLPRPDQDE